MDIPLIALTGSNGKTTTKELLHAVLSKKYKTLATIGNLNNHIGVPLTLLRLREEHEMTIIEMGANHRGEIEELCMIAAPNFGLITNLGKAHLEGFGGEEGVAKGKSELYYYLFKNRGLTFINANQERLVKLSQHLTRKRYYGTHQFPLFAEPDHEIRLVHSAPNVIFSLGGPEITSNLTSTYNFENIMTAAAVGEYFEVADEDIEAAIASYLPQNSRSQFITKGTNTILLDAYNANPTSMEHALRNFASLKQNHKVVILGDMFELGDESASEHKRIAGLVRELDFEEAYLVGKDFMQQKHPSIFLLDHAN